MGFMAMVFGVWCLAYGVWCKGHGYGDGDGDGIWYLARGMGTVMSTASWESDGTSV